MRVLVYGFWIVFLAACLTVSGCVGHDALWVKCKGEGQITGTAAIGGGILYGGGGTYNLTLGGNCGEGFEYQRGTRPPKAERAPAAVTP